ncbi:MAG: polysaccharide pyruvyl transferase family protein [Pseudomonadota bacterium]
MTDSSHNHHQGGQSGNEPETRSVQKPKVSDAGSIVDGGREIGKIAIFNVKYSPNLGDGIIAECLEHQLQKSFASAQIVSIDLAGRTDWQRPKHSNLRRTMLWILQTLPQNLRDAAMQTVFGALVDRKLAPFYAGELAGAEVALIGGGQLIQDVDLNFPLKLTCVARTCRALHVPMGLVAVGASRPEPAVGRGKQLLSDLLDDTLFIATARDEASIDNLKKRGCDCVSMCRDPGLLASRKWPVARNGPRDESRTIGLGITHPIVLAHHGTGQSRPQSQELTITAFARLARALTDEGRNRVVLFTNGAAEDVEACDRVLVRLSEFASGEPGLDQISRAERPPGPRALAEQIAGFDAVVAHRLHANIVAYSYARPMIGLQWDKKLDGFFEAVGHGDRLMELAGNNCDDIARRTFRALDEPFDFGRHAAELDQCERDIENVARSIQETLTTPTKEQRTGPAAREKCNA